MPIPKGWKGRFKNLLSKLLNMCGMAQFYLCFSRKEKNVSMLDFKRNGHFHINLPTF